MTYVRLLQELEMEVTDLIKANPEMTVREAEAIALSGNAPVSREEIIAKVVAAGGTCEFRDGRFHAIAPTGRAVIFKAYADGSAHVYSATGPTHGAYAWLASIGIAKPPDTPEQKAEKQARALRLWGEAVPAGGTIVERYLRSRELLIVPDCLRFHPKLYHFGAKAELPAMIAARCDVKGDVIAIHRTWLRGDGSGKAAVEPQRADLGPVRGTAIRLSPVASEMLIGEGIETTLAAMRLSGKPGWAAGSAGMMKEMQLPPEVRVLRLLVDVNDEGAGERETAEAKARFVSEGRTVIRVRPPHGGDFNDTLMEEARNAEK
ncbi:DUF7146 domain-containing protein [Pseudorhodoplanes sp.]|uniref:DUF7146 domain-containing protein n=1 Tax=Pseudorhodoplanes sp. TaxID=1934341 RepID=UPI003D141860